jgi:hypothetical protein
MMTNVIEDIRGYVVLLDSDLQEVVPRQECLYDWDLIPGGATFVVTSHHTFDIQGKEVSYMAIFGRGSEQPVDDGLVFVGVLAEAPVAGPAEMLVGRGTRAIEMGGG